VTAQQRDNKHKTRVIYRKYRVEIPLQCKDVREGTNGRPSKQRPVVHASPRDCRDDFRVFHPARHRSATRAKRRLAQFSPAQSAGCVRSRTRLLSSSRQLQMKHGRATNFWAAESVLGSRTMSPTPHINRLQDNETLIAFENSDILLACNYFCYQRAALSHFAKWLLGRFWCGMSQNQLCDRQCR
jgi:hypothetical protein